MIGRLCLCVYVCECVCVCVCVCMSLSKCDWLMVDRVVLVLCRKF